MCVNSRMPILGKLADAYAWGWNAGAGHDFHGLGDGPPKLVLGVLFGTLLTVGILLAVAFVAHLARHFWAGLRRGHGRPAPERQNAPASEDAGAMGER